MLWLRVNNGVQLLRIDKHDTHTPLKCQQRGNANKLRLSSDQKERMSERGTRKIAFAYSHTAYLESNLILLK
jgi:hypothetical protein